MPVRIRINNREHYWPSENDLNWADHTTRTIRALADSTLQKSHTLFSLSQQLDFGPEHGIKVRDISLAAPNGESRRLTCDDQNSLTFSGKKLVFLDRLTVYEGKFRNLESYVNSIRQHFEMKPDDLPESPSYTVSFDTSGTPAINVSFKGITNYLHKNEVNYNINSHQYMTVSEDKTIFRSDSFEFVNGTDTKTSLTGGNLNIPGNIVTPQNIRSQNYNGENITLTGGLTSKTVRASEDVVFNGNLSCVEMNSRVNQALAFNRSGTGYIREWFEGTRTIVDWRGVPNNNQGQFWATFYLQENRNGNWVNVDVESTWFHFIILPKDTWCQRPPNQTNSRLPPGVHINPEGQIIYLYSLGHTLLHRLVMAMRPDGTRYGFHHKAEGTYKPLFDSGKVRFYYQWTVQF